MQKRSDIRASVFNRIKLKYTNLRYRLSKKPINYRINLWYGRLGNNVQQIIIAIMHAESLKGVVDITEEQLAIQGLDQFFFPILYDFTDKKTIAGIYQSNFFFFEGFGFSLSRWPRLHCLQGFLRLESLLSANYVNANLHRVCQNYLLPQLRSGQSPSFTVNESSLVIHLRGGDVANMGCSVYALNPLCYYQFLSDMYRDIVLVAEPGPAHPLLDKIRELFPNCKVVSGSVQEDFELLRGARLLASSGVGTFCMAAALLSEKLQRFYCSSAYLNEHLNPAILDTKRVKVIEYKMKDYLGLWRKSKNRLDLLLNYRP
jgi:hypothetical protein